MSKYFEDINWENLLSDSCPDTNYKSFLNIYNIAIEKFVPLYPIFKSKNSKRTQWWNRELTGLTNERNAAWRLYKNDPSLINFQKFKKKRNSITSLKRKLKSQFENNLVTNAKSRPEVLKKVFKYIRSRTSVKDRVSAVKGPNGELSRSDMEAANYLNAAFHSVFVGNNYTYDDYVNVDLGNKFSPIMDNDIDFAVNQLKVGSAAGPDHVAPSIIKSCKAVLIKPLKIIFNQSLKTGTVPSDWKCADVTPIFKKGSRSDPLNYRPISLTSIPGKIMERIIKCRLIDYLTDKELLSNKQHGFLKNKSTISNLLEFYDFVTSELDSGACVDIIFLDMLKAFDTVPHHTLIKRLKELNINPTVVRWVLNYLADRKQRVRVRDGFSDWAKVSSGVPQGSVLGPILFLIFINSLPNEINSFCNMFADDTKMAGRVSDMLPDKITTDLANISSWAIDSGVNFNPTKCHVMHLGRGNPQRNYTINGTSLPVVSEERDLGVLVDSSLKFHKHVSSATKAANAMIGMVRRNFTLINKNMFLLLYKSLIRPKIEYAVQLWSPFLHGDINLLENVQRRATKLVGSIKSLSYEERLKRLGLTTLADRRERGDAILTHSILTKKVKLTQRPVLLRDSQPLVQTRGNSLKLQAQWSRLEIRRNFFSLRVVKGWNALPDSVVSVGSSQAFKGGYDRSYNAKVASARILS
jgi:hypothetical protein